MKEQNEEDQNDQQNPRKLNWTKTLFDYHICLDAEAFEKWDGNMEMHSQDILEKDIPRTRCSEPNMKKQSFRQVLRRITTFYCKQNGINYQQGLLQVVYPFALFRRKDFQTKKCYAYFNAFMRKFFPKVLVQRVVEGKKQLPHAILALTLTEILLRFHYPELSHVFKDNQIPISLIATQELLTIFAKGLAVELVYQIYDYFIQKNNPNFIFYMQVALVGLQEASLIEAAGKEKLHKEIQEIKKIRSKKDLQGWFALSQKIARETPQSFETLVKQFCFTNRNLLSSEDVQRMLKSNEILGGHYLSISIEQINENVDKYILVTLQKYSNNQKNYQIFQLNPQKLPNKDSLNFEKIYVLTVHEKKVEEELQLLLKWSFKIQNVKFLILKEHLMDQKLKKCSIF